MTAQVTRPQLALKAAVQRCATFQGGIGLRVGVPAVSVLAAVVLVDVLRSVFSAGGVFLLLLLPVLLASILCGARSGLLAVALGVLGAGFIAAARAHPWLSEPTDTLRVIPYLCIGGFIIVMGEVLRSPDFRRTRVDGVAAPITLAESLTRREAEILGLAASGLTIDEIAQRLCLSRNTIKSHLAHAYGKLGARNRAEAVAMGLHSGVIDHTAVTSRVVDMVEGVTDRERWPSGAADAPGLATAATGSAVPH